MKKKEVRNNIIYVLSEGESYELTVTDMVIPPDTHTHTHAQKQKHTHYVNICTFFKPFPWQKFVFARFLLDYFNTNYAKFVRKHDPKTIAWKWIFLGDNTAVKGNAEIYTHILYKMSKEREMFYSLLYVTHTYIHARTHRRICKLDVYIIRVIQPMPASGR